MCNYYTITLNNNESKIKPFFRPSRTKNSEGSSSISIVAELLLVLSEDRSEVCRATSLRCCISLAQYCFVHDYRTSASNYYILFIISQLDAIKTDKHLDFYKYKNTLLHQPSPATTGLRCQQPMYAAAPPWQ